MRITLTIEQPEVELAIKPFVVEYSTVKLSIVPVKVYLEDIRSRFFCPSDFQRGHQNFGIISENEVFQKIYSIKDLNLEKKSHQLIFLN